MSIKFKYETKAHKTTMKPAERLHYNTTCEFSIITKVVIM